MKLRNGFVAAMAVGAVMVIGTLALSLPSKTAGVKRLTDTMRPAFSTSGIAQARSDLSEVQAMAAQLQSQVSPALSQELHLTPTQFSAFLGKNFPAVATGVSQLGTILPRFDGLVAGLQAEQGNFDKADAIALRKPVHLPPTVVPWLLIAPGLLVLGLGGVGLARPRRSRRAPAAAIAVIGVVLIIAPFAVSVPAKAKAVDGLTTAFRPSLTAPAVRQSTADLHTVQAMATQLETQLLPALAKALKVTPTQLGTTLNTAFPAFGRGVTDLPAIVPRFAVLVKDLQTISGTDFNDAS
jgi:hypothetical protein